MAASPAPAPSSPPKGGDGVLATALIVALILVLAAQLAYWTWAFLAPPARRAAEAPPPAVDPALVARLFGGTGGRQGAATASATPDLRLKGVIAPTPGVAASAIFSRGAGRDASVFVGGEVQPGVKLVEVHPSHVILSRDGVRERLDLEAARGLAAAKPGAPRQGGFRLEVARVGTNSFSLSRRELDDALRDPNQLGYLGQIGTPAGGGVRMEQAPPGSLAQKLGLQPGDVIRKVNGQVVASPGDLARLYTQFATLSTIQAEVQRGPAIVQLSYAIRQ